MKQSFIERQLTELFAPVIEDMGFSLVWVRVKGAKGSQIVEIMAENPETKRLGVDDCAKISRDLSALMDVEDPIKGKYRLEVSSPGIDRPLVSFDDFMTYKGFEAKITINPPLDTGQKRFKGRIEQTGDETITLKTEQGDFVIDYGAIETAKLVLTDDLIESTKTA